MSKQPSFYLAHLKIPIFENCKYLGITISTKNSDLDLKRQMRKIYANANLRVRKFTHVPTYVIHTYTYLSHILTMYYYRQCRYIFQRW